ncbi:MAG: tetratricopeptide repeat protein [Atribacterota bacterium]|nr:tetratricopeptide repeat protein [Atribacterota bacterium]
MIYWFKLFKKYYKVNQFQSQLLTWFIAIGLIIFTAVPEIIASPAPDIAIYYFNNQTGDEGLQWLEEDLAVTISQSLSKIDQVNLMPLSEINTIADQGQYQNMVQKKDSISFGHLANLLKVDLIFSGNYFQDAEGQIDLDLLMYASSTGHLVEFRRISAPLDDLYNLKERIIRNILQESDIDPNRVPLEAIIEAEIVEIETDVAEEMPPDMPVVEEPRRDLAQIASLFLDDQSASEYYKKALELKEKAILEYGGADYPSKPLWNEAIQNATKAVELDPDFADGYYLLYEIFRKTKWIAREIESLELYVDTVQRTGKQVNNIEFSILLTRLAHLKYNAGDPSSAVYYLEKAISYNQNDIDARSYLMRIYYDTGQGTKALQQAEAIKRIQPESIELDWFASRTQRISIFGQQAFESYERGYNSYIVKNYSEAINYLEQAISMAPAFKDAHYYLGLSYYHYGNLDGAIRHWEEAVRLDPFDNHARIYLNKALEEKEYGRDAVWRFNEGYEHYIAGEYEDALAVFKSSTQLNPNFEKARTFLMRTYFHLDRMDEYAEERRRIGENIEYTGGMEREFYQLGYDFYSIGDYNVALEKLRESLEINPDYLEARFLIAETLYQLKDYHEANIHYKYIIDNYPNSEYYENSLLGSGWCLYLLEEYPQSEEHLKLLIDNFPKSPLYEEGIYKLGRVYFVQEKYPLAIQLYEGLLDSESSEYDLVDIKYILGQSYFWLEDYEQSKKYLLDIIENNPGFKQIDETKYYYSFTLFREERYHEAMGVLEKLLEKKNSPVENEAAYLLGRTLLEQREYDRVIEINSSLIEKDAVEEYILERALFDLGLSYSRKDDDENAVPYFQRVIKEFPLGELAGLSKIELAQSLYHLGKYQDSIDVLEDTNTKEAMEIKLDSATRLGDEELLLSLYKEAEEIYPDGDLSVDGFYALAKTQFESNKYQEAIETFIMIEGMDITEQMRMEINYWKGLSFYRLADYNQAKDNFQKVDYLEESEISARSLYMLAETCYQQADFKSAITYYKDFLQHYGTHSLTEHVQYSIAWSYLNDKDYQNALLSFQELIQQYPDSSFIEESVFLTGKINYLISDNNNSMTKLTGFIDKYPDSEYLEEAIYIIAQIVLEDQQWIDSILYFERLINNYPDSRYMPGSLYGLCLSYYKKEEYNKAVSAGERYLNSYPGGTFKCDILYISAISQQELGNMDEAYNYYTQIVNDCPDSSYSDSAQEQLDYLNDLL